MYEDTTACIRAVRSRDARFDGWFTTAVLTTGIYCRPSCPAMTPRPENMRFFPTAAAAQRAGFRACKRCLPDAVPGSPEWSVRTDVAARAVRLIADGAVDREGVAGLARRLGYSVRQVERILTAELGAEPVALARAQRAHTARILIESTPLPMADVAFAAGFASVRSFNDTVRRVFDVTPSQLRARRQAPGGPERLCDGAWQHVALRLPARLPFAPNAALDHLGRTAVPGVEEWRDGTYRRTLRMPHGAVVLALTPRADHVAARLWLADLRDLTGTVARCRALLDLDADPIAVDAHLGQDPLLAPLVRARPGGRLPRTVDPSEMALRVVLGQQVSTRAAATTTARLVAAHGTPVSDPEQGGLTHLFPTVETVAGLDPADVPGPRARARTLVTVAAALADGTLDVGPGADRAETRERLHGIPGIGPWTVEMTAMRCLGDPDAYPATDLGVVQSLRSLGIAGDSSRPSWRPWRAYAVQHLWTAEPTAASAPSAFARPPARTHDEARTGAA